MAIKQVVVVRTDLDMGKGKIAAQVGHACVLGAEHVRKSNPDWFSEWWKGQEKVVLKVANLKELEQVKQDAIEFGMPWSEVGTPDHCGGLVSKSALHDLGVEPTQKNV